MEDLEKRAIEDLPVVSSVCLHAGDKTHRAGVYVNLRCCEASSYGGCGAKLVGPIRKSGERPTNVDCFRELGRVIQRDHGPTCIAAAQELQAVEKAAVDASTKRPADEAATSLNANDVLMLRAQLKSLGEHAEEWDPSADTDASEAPVTMIVNSSELRASGFDLREVLPL